MDTYLLDWAQLLLRWLHVVVAIAWIGSSFYFVFLDSSLTEPTDPELRRQGVSGELWAVHGGGFYHPVKFAGAPPQLPAHLHWFYWESYSTWLSGFALFALIYLWQASIYLVDPSVLDWHPAWAGAAALALMAGFWLAYDGLCRVLACHPSADRLVGLGTALLVLGASWLACHAFAGRAAFLIVGATLATSMSANVWRWIIPGQRIMVADLQAGRAVDPIHGRRGKQRSVHNTYLTLPVVFCMLSSHTPMLSSHADNWLLLVGLMGAGAAVRQFFVLRHGYKLGRHRHPWPWAAGAVLSLALVAWWARPEPQTESNPKLIANNPIPTRADAKIGYEQLAPVLAERCTACHGAQQAMKGVRLDSALALQQQRQAMYQQVVVLRNMPLNNATGMTADERALLARWYAQAAP